jgi:tetratricopeptide (TPR) repeat protein
VSPISADLLRHSVFMTIDELLKRGWELHRTGRFKQAEECYRQVVQLDPGHARALHLLGIIALQMERFGEAQAWLTNACAAAPNQADCFSNLALAYRGLGRLPDAEQALREAVRLKPDAEIFNNLGTVLLELGRPLEAEAAWRGALKLRPDHPEALNNLGTVLLQLNRPAEAVSALRESLRLAPANAKILFNLGAAYQAAGQLPEAEGLWRQTLRLQPEHAEAHHNLGTVLLELGSAAEAEAYLREALRLRPEQVESRINLCKVLVDLDQPAEAEPHLREALRLKPESAKAHDVLGTVLMQLGRLDEAEASFREALRIDPEHTAAHTQLATMLSGRLPDSDRAALETMLAANTRPEARAGLLFGLAHVYDGQGEYATAARHLREANALALGAASKRGKAYEPVDHSRFVSDLQQACTPEFFRRPPGSDSQLPVFVFGLPRSGTTLIEQILASHPRVYGAGELSIAGKTLATLPSLLQRRENPWACAAQIDEPTTRRLAGAWLDHLRALGEGKDRVVDKMPDNYLQLGLIALLFPNARLIHCRRDLRDIAVSCWLTNFRKIPWANDPQHIASRFDAYVEVMKHWRKVLPVPVLEVDYEATVDDLEGVARRLISWCGLEWDPACLAFHETKRTVRTASVAQVRQPIYRRAVARWKNYERELAPLFALLPPVQRVEPGTVQ